MHGHGEIYPVFSLYTRLMITGRVYKTIAIYNSTVSTVHAEAEPWMDNFGSGYYFTGGLQLTVFIEKKFKNNDDNRA